MEKVFLQSSFNGYVLIFPEFLCYFSTVMFVDNHYRVWSFLWVCSWILAVTLVYSLLFFSLIYSIFEYWILHMFHLHLCLNTWTYFLLKSLVKNPRFSCAWSIFSLSSSWKPTSPSLSLPSSPENLPLFYYRHFRTTEPDISILTLNWVF